MEEERSETEGISLYAALICIFLESRLSLRLRLLAQLIINLLMLHILGFACLPAWQDVLRSFPAGCSRYPATVALAISAAFYAYTSSSSSISRGSS